MRVDFLSLVRMTHANHALDQDGTLFAIGRFHYVRFRRVRQAPFRGILAAETTSQ